LWNGLREELSPVIITAATILSFLSVVLMTVVEALRAKAAAARRSEKNENIRFLFRTFPQSRRSKGTRFPDLGV
jgi:hypothetical protein